MNEEVKETIKILQNNSLVKSGSYEFIGDSDITYAEIYILLKLIEDLQQENQKYKEVIDKVIEYIETCNPNVDLHSEFLDESYLSNYGAKELLDILKGGGINETTRI